MRLVRAFLVGAVLLSAGLGEAARPRASGRAPKVSLRCVAASGEELTARSRSRLTGPISCSVALASEGRFNAILQARGKECFGPDRSGLVEHNRPVRVELKPGSDFVICADFEIGARIEDDFGKVLWTSRLPIRQGCVLKKIKADFACAVERNGREVALPSKGKAKLDGPIRCKVTSKDAAFARARVTLAVNADGRHAIKEAAPEPNGEAWAARFELSPSADLGGCARSVRLTTEAALDGAPAFERSVAVRQDCAE
jgi:hypothetical protein